MDLSHLISAQRLLGIGFVCLLLGLAVVMPCWQGCDVHAKTIYSYIDEQGNPVFTDAPETIPQRYRAKVKMHEQRTDEQPVSLSQSVERRLRGQIRTIRSFLPTFRTGIYGLGPRQSEIVTYAGLATVVLLMVMYLAKSQFTRLLGLGLLVLLGFAVPVLLYVTDDGPSDRLQKATAAAGQAQDERLKQASQ